MHSIFAFLKKNAICFAAQIMLLTGDIEVSYNIIVAQSISMWKEALKE